MLKESSKGPAKKGDDYPTFEDDGYLLTVSSNSDTRELSTDMKVNVYTNYRDIRERKKL